MGPERLLLTYGIRVVGATIMPTKGAAIPAYDTGRGAAVRKAANAWIRGGGAFDAVVDLDHVFADPADPDRMRAEFDSGDGVHPNDTGMRAIAGAIAGSPGFIRAATGPPPPTAWSSGR